MRRSSNTNCASAPNFFLTVDLESTRTRPVTQDDDRSRHPSAATTPSAGWLLSARGLLRGGDWRRAVAKVNKNVLVPPELRDAQNRFVVRPSENDVDEAALCGIALVSRRDGEGRQELDRHGLPRGSKFAIPWESRRAPGSVPHARLGHAKLFNAMMMMISSILIGSMPTPDVVGVMIDGKREVFHHSLLSRLLQGLMGQKLGRIVDPVLMPTALAYRPFDGVRTGLFAARALGKRGFVWAAKADIRRFFPAVTYEHVAQALLQIAPVHESIREIIEWMLSAPILRNVDHPEVAAGRSAVRSEPLRALYQGSPIAPLLSNVVGAAVFDVPFASAMNGLGVVLLRYADDLLVLSVDRKGAQAGLTAVRALAAGANFEIHEDPNKTSPHPVDLREETIKWLGYDLGYGQVRLSDAKFAKMISRLACADPDDPTQSGSFVEPVLRLAFDPSSRLDELREAAVGISDEHFHRIEETIVRIKTDKRTRWIAAWQRHADAILKAQS
jgi:hypothetical protein